MKQAAAFCALLLIAAPALCQQDTELDNGSRIPVPRRARIPDNAAPAMDQARVTISEFARCVVARNPVAVARALNMLPGVERSRAMAHLATSECLDDGTIKMPQIIMRGAIFVELYRLYSAKKKTVVVPQPLRFTDPLDPEYLADPRQFALLEFGDCVVKRDAMTAQKVVTLPTASKLQNAAFKALIPELGPCVSAGQNITFSKPVIEGALAEVLYRETVAPSAALGSK